MDRNTRAKIIWQAEKQELATKAKGRPAGDLGQTALALLRLLLFRYGDRPAPSYAALQRHSGFCLQTISNALRRLRHAGFLAIERRTIHTRMGARRITNLYSFPASLPLGGRPQKKPIERLFKDKAFVPWDAWSSPVKDALDRLGASMLRRWQEDGS